MLLLLDVSIPDRRRNGNEDEHFADFPLSQPQQRLVDLRSLRTSLVAQAFRDIAWVEVQDTCLSSTT